MDAYRHHVSGFFAHRTEAEIALSTLVARGLPQGQLQLIDAESLKAPAEPKDGSNEVLTNVLVDGAIGTAVGTGIGALAQVAIVAANISLFIASPLVALLIMLGWAGGPVSAPLSVPLPAQPRTSSTRMAGFRIWCATRSSAARWYWSPKHAAAKKRLWPGKSLLRQWAKSGMSVSSSRRPHLR